jgi:hypothetical protein
MQDITRTAAEEISDVIKTAKAILLDNRVQQFTGADVVATAALILRREDQIKTTTPKN